MIRYVFDKEKVLPIKGKDKANPQKIGEELARLSAKTKGRLTPKAIVEAAKDSRNILHRHFDWEDKTAAQKWRISQAQDLVRAIHTENADTESGVARAFLSINDKDGTSYRALDEVLSSADLQSKVLAAAERDLLTFEQRYRNLTDICDLIREARHQITLRRSKHESRAVT